MSVIAVTTVQQGPAIPAGVTRASTKVVVTDSANNAQQAILTGQETPAWSAQFTVAAGKGGIVATDLDTNGNVIGTPVTASYDTGTVAPPPGLQTSGVNVTIVTP